MQVLPSDHNMVPAPLITRERRPAPGAKPTFTKIWRDVFTANIPAITQKKIVITGIVGEGLGDYAHMLSAARLLSKKFKDILILPIIEGKHKKLFPAGPKLRCEPLNIEKLYSPLPLTEEVLTKFEEADIIVEMSIPLRRRELIKGKELVFDPKEQEKYQQNYLEMKINPRKLITLPEYSINHGRMASSGMGLGENELGIFIKPKKTNRNPSDLNSPVLREVLSRSVNQGNHFNLVYTHNLVHLKTCIYAQVVSQKNNSKNIDIFTKLDDLNNLKSDENFIKLGELTLNIEFLKTNGIGKVKFIKNEQEKEIIISDDNHKELQLIYAFPLEQSDMNTLMSLVKDVNEEKSEEANFPFVGCTGDDSFTRVISNDKIPLYEIALWKEDAFRNYKSLAMSVLSKEETSYIDYLNYLLKLKKIEGKSLNSTVEQGKVDQACQKIAEKIVGVSKEKGFYLQAQKVHQHIKEHKNVNKHLIKSVSSLIFFQEKKAFEDKFKNEFQDLKKRYESDEINIKQATKKIGRLVKNLILEKSEHQIVD